MTGPAPTSSAQTGAAPIEPTPTRSTPPGPTPTRSTPLGPTPTRSTPPGPTPTRSAPLGPARPWEVGSAFSLPSTYDPVTLPRARGASALPGTPDAVTLTSADGGGEGGGGEGCGGEGCGARWPSPARLFGSGRQALVALLRFGARRHGWSAVHLPAYFCPPVAEAARDALAVLPYDGGPGGGDGPAVVGPTEVVVAVSYFGLPPVLPARRGAALVVDATHDPRAPWLADLDADFVLASLRKTLPLPDGGLLWSPAGRALPEPAATTGSHRLTAERVLTGMLAKGAYLGGAPVAKESYLELLRAGEQELATSRVSGACAYTRLMLPTLPADELRAARVGNARRLAAGLVGLPGIAARAYPLGVVCAADDGDRREEIRRALVARDVYPAVLWELPEAAPAAQRDLSRRLLFLPTDHRYGGADLDRVAAVLREAAHAAAARRPATGPPAGDDRRPDLVPWGR